MKMIIKSMALIISIIILSCPARAESMLIDGVAARVNNRIITVGEVMTILQPVQRQLAAAYKGDELKNELRAAYTRALETLVERDLILEFYAKQEKMVIPEWVVDERVEEIIHSMFKGDRGALIEELDKDGVTFDEWKEQVYNSLIVTYMRRLKVDDKLKISPNAARDVYNENLDQFKVPGQVKLRMIVVGKAPPGPDAEQKRQLIVGAAKRLAADEDFAEVARSVSEGSKAEQGGEWDWIETKMLRPELVKPATLLQSGEMSRIVETKEEFYILKVEGRKDEKVAPFETVQAEIESGLRQKEIKTLYDAWIDRLEDGASVTIYNIRLFP